MSEEEREELNKLLLEEVLPKVTKELTEALVLFENENDRHQWNFGMGLYLFVVALQMTEQARKGAMTQARNFTIIAGLDWAGLRSAAYDMIKKSDERLLKWGQTDEVV